MRKYIITLVIVLSITICTAQTYKKDTIMVDTSQVEKIRKMPMDTMHHPMPIKPLTHDTVIDGKTNEGVKPRKNEEHK